MNEYRREPRKEFVANPNLLSLDAVLSSFLHPPTLPTEQKTGIFWYHSFSTAGAMLFRGCFSVAGFVNSNETVSPVHHLA